MSLLQVIDILVLGVFVMLLSSLIAANGRMRRWTVLVACVALELLLAMISLFFVNESLPFTGLRVAGRGIELIGVLYYFLRQENLEPSSPVSGELDPAEWDKRIRGIVKEEVANLFEEYLVAKHLPEQ